MSREISTIVTGMSYLEGPRWHDQRVWFSDFYTCRVYSAAEDGSDLRTEAEVPGQPSGLGWLPDGRLLIVSMRDGRLLRREPDGTLVTHADVSGYLGGHLNDMVTDARGRVFVGEFGFDLMSGADLTPAGLLRVDPDGTVTKVAGDLWFPNGSVITEDGTLLVDETFGNRVTAFDIAEDGTLANRRTWAKFGELPGDRELGKMLAQVVALPTAAAWTRTARCGSPTASTAGSSGCGRAARSPRRSSSAPASSPACSAEPTAAPCSSAPRLTSRRKRARTLARPAW